MWQTLYFVKISCAQCVRGESINRARLSFRHAYLKKRSAVVSVSVAKDSIVNIIFPSVLFHSFHGSNSSKSRSLMTWPSPVLFGMLPRLSFWYCRQFNGIPCCTATTDPMITPPILFSSRWAPLSSFLWDCCATVNPWKCTCPFQ